MEQKENKIATWEDLRDGYKSAAITYVNGVSYIKNIYEKYKVIIDKEPNTKRVLDGAANTLLGIKKMIDGLALSHVEKAIEEDKKNGVEVFEGPNGELLKFKSGPIPDDDKIIETTVKTILSYGALSNNIIKVIKNTIAVLLQDLEKIINNIEDEEERERLLKMLEKDKAELEESGNTEVSNESE